MRARPSLSDATISRILAIGRSYECEWPTWSTTPARSAAVTMSCAWATPIAIGFSVRTCFVAAQTSATCCGCSSVGVAI